MESPHDLLPARMLNEFAYCPRLFHLEHVEGLFADNPDTVKGRSVHRRIDRKEDPLPESDGDTPRIARSVMLSSAELGLIARVDLIEADCEGAVPVDTKKGWAPDVPEGVYEPERVQLCAQGLLLRAHGEACTHGFIYFAQSHQRVRVDFDDRLIERTHELAQQARSAAHATQAPPPLVDSPKCPRCSLVGICLPDEVNYLLAGDGSAGQGRAGDGEESSAPRPPSKVRRLVPARGDTYPVYVQGQGLYVSKQGETLRIGKKGQPETQVKLIDVAHLAIFGNNQISTQAIQALCGKEIPISWFSGGGWFYGTLQGTGLRNVFLRRAQFRAADDTGRCLKLARHFVAGKISNARTLLMRNHANPPGEVVEALRRHVRLAEEAEDLQTLLGIEGNAARLYFSGFGAMLKPRAADDLLTFDFRGRNRRPPKDPVNAMLSLAYSLLVRDVTTVLSAVGFDPYVGFFHQPRHGRPALALDLIEEFRPLIGDSIVLTVINNGEAAGDDFIESRAGCALSDAMRARFIRAYERRMDSLVTHPLFDYRASYRRILEIQARLLGRFLMGEVPEYAPFTTR